MLPLTAKERHQRRSGTSSRKWIPEYLLRMWDFQQMDFQYTFTQMVFLCRSPGEVYKSTQYRKQIKNQWARDDPAFVVVLLVFLACATTAYSITFGVTSFTHWLRILAHTVLIDFLGLGLLIAFVGRWLANTYLKPAPSLSFNVEQEVEWLYAFDIHCNGFFPMFILLYVVQFFLCPLLTTPDLFSTMLANSLYAFAFSYYFYITFLGYNSLPFLQNTQYFLYPIVLIAGSFFLALLVNFNVARFTLSFYLS